MSRSYKCHTAGSNFKSGPAKSEAVQLVQTKYGCYGLNINQIFLQLSALISMTDKLMFFFSDQTCDRDAVLSQATFIVRNNLNVMSCTIQIEPYNEEIISACSKCQSLDCC